MYQGNRLFKAKGPNGFVNSAEIKYEYDTNGKLQTVTKFDGSKMHYNMTGSKLNWVKDASWKSVASYTYDGKNRVKTAEGTGGKTPRKIDYWKPVHVTDLSQSTTVQEKYAFIVKHSAMKVEKLIDAAGHSEIRRYDANGFPQKTVAKNGQTTNLTYNARGLQAVKVESAGTNKARRTETIWHSVFRKPETITEPGKVTVIEYNGAGLPYRQTVTANGTDRVTQTTYENGQPKTVTAPNGALTTMTYVNGNRTSTTTPAGVDKTLIFDTAGRPKKTRDMNDRTTTMVYDATGRLKKTTATNLITKNEYFPDGRLKKVTNPDNSFEVYTYDSQGNRETAKDQDNNITTFDYDDNGNVKSQTVKDATGTTVLSQTSEYNTMNQLKKITDGSGESTAFKDFDAMGNPEKTFDAKNQLTKKTYDLQNRLKIVQDAKGKLTKYAYDNNGNLFKVTAPNGAVTTMFYDALNQLTREVSPDRGTTLYENYDASGNVQKITDANANVKILTYDALNRVKTEKWLGATQLNVTYTYDNCPKGKGKLCKVTDSSGSTAFEYDWRGNLKKQTQRIGGTTLSHTFKYNGQNKLENQIYPSGRSVAYHYAGDKLIGINIDGGQFIKNIQYDGANQIKGWQWHNGKQVTRKYDDNGRLKTFSLRDDSRTLDYDPVGNLERWDDRNAQGALLTYKTFDHDELNRLRTYDEYKHINGAPDQRLQHQIFGYGNNGNRKQLTDNSTVTNYTIKYQSNRMTKINNQNIGYDGNGNIRSDGQHSYTYDARNRMSGVDGNTFFTYNAVDQRVKKSGSNGTTLYAWANDRIIGEYTSGGQAKNETLYMGNTPVGIIKSGTRYRVYADQTDTPRLITTQGNTTVWRWKSKPFGEGQPNEDVDGNGNNFVYNLRFPGQYYDVETKTHYNYRRDYNPKTGRYIQSDPIGISGGIGTYSYVSNSPLMGRDPRGEFFSLPSVLATAAVIVVGGIISQSDTQVGSVSRSTDDGRTIYHHYTNFANYFIIDQARVIAASNGVVFASRQQLAPIEVEDLIFIGNPEFKGRGDYVISFQLKSGVEFVPVSELEEIHYGSLYFGRHIDVVYSGKNNF